MIRHFIYFTLILLLFLISKGLINSLYPVVNMSDWVHRDMLKNIPRIIGIIFCLMILKKEIILDLRQIQIMKQKNFLLVMLFTLMSIPTINLMVERYWFSTNEFLVLIVGSILVGLFEELLFRKLLLGALKKHMNVLWSALLSSFLFMLFHFQSHHIALYPYLFLMGLLFAALAVKGVSIWFLILFHSIYDLLYIFYFRIDLLPWHLALIELFWISLAIGAVATFPSQCPPSPLVQPPSANQCPVK